MTTAWPPLRRVFSAAVNEAVAYLKSVITNPVTINVDVGWGEVGGQKIGSNTLGESDTNYVGPYTYGQIESALTADVSSSADAAALSTLPNTDPTGGGAFYITTAEAKALGLVAATDPTIDGFVGFSSATSWDFNPNGRGVAGEYDIIGTIEHEITEVMGRSAGLNDPAGSGYTVLDLFRYSAPGPLAVKRKRLSLFFRRWRNYSILITSIKTQAGTLETRLPVRAMTLFLAFTNAGVADVVTPTDLTVMNVLGWKFHGPRRRSIPSLKRPATATSALVRTS